MTSITGTITVQILDRVGKGLDVVFGHQEAGLAVANDVRNAAAGEGHDRQPHRLRLKVNEAVAFIDARPDEEIRVLEEIRDRFAFAATMPSNAL